jgi:hypothetical protein
MKDYKLKQRNLRASHTLGWSGNWNTLDFSNEEKAAHMKRLLAKVVFPSFERSKKNFRHQHRVRKELRGRSNTRFALN